MSTLHSFESNCPIFFPFFSLSQFKLDTVSKQAQYTVRQIPGEMFADKDSSYGPEVEALCGQLWVKACLKLVRMLLICFRRCPAVKAPVKAGHMLKHISTQFKAALTAAPINLELNSKKCLGWAGCWGPTGLSAERVKDRCLLRCLGVVTCPLLFRT